MKVKLQETRIKGIPASKGIAIGQLYYIDIQDDQVSEFTVSIEAIPAEIERYRQAVRTGIEEIQKLQMELDEEDGSESLEILESHLHMMHDPTVMAEVEEEIRLTNKNAESVYMAVMKRFQTKLNLASDPYFLDRLKDIRDVSRRILGCLRRDYRSNFLQVPKGAIVFLRELSPTDVVEASAQHVAAFVTQGGGVTSHAAIVSKAKGLPLLTSVDFNQLELPEDAVVIVDGFTGDLYINPEPEILEEYRELQKKNRGCKKSTAKAKSLKAKTSDGQNIQLSANISMVDEISLLQQNSGLSVGLFRSEYVFLGHEEFPSEDKQYEVYRHIVTAMKGAPIVIRAFDLGGDKYLFGQKAPYENNPFLGCRAIRFLLRERHLFKSQLKAILRASVLGDVSVMFPMVSSLEELHEAKDLLREAELELNLYDGIKVKPIRVGCMIEVPAAAIIADLLAKESDFLSIGSNDLVQYTLAVDRGNHALSGLYTFAHPGIIRLVKQITVAAKREGIPVSICGEVAADPIFTPLLLGLGINELSVALCHLPVIKMAIRNCSMKMANDLAASVLLARTSKEIEELLKNSIV